MKLKTLLEGFAWERTPGKPLPTLNDVAKKHNEPTTEPVTEAILKSNIMSKWSSSDVANKDLQEFLKALYMDRNYDTMDDMAAMFNILSKLSKDYLRKMR